MPNQLLTNVTTTLQNQLNNNFALLNDDLGLPLWVASTIILSVIVGVSSIAYYITQFILVRLATRFSAKQNHLFTRIALKNRVFHQIAMLVPGYIIYSTIHFIEVAKLPFSNHVANAISMLASLYLIIIFTLVVSSVLTSIDKRYQFFQISRQYSIRSYIQILKIISFGLSGILIVSILLGKSPTYFLTGLGAMTAVLMLVFRDSLLGFVASIQLSAYDMVRLGDWIELPSYGANGDVIDISLNTIKVQNFDKTIVTIPSYALLTTGVKNWRGMSESGGRRIKRSILIDVNSITFCTDDMLKHYVKLPTLSERLSTTLSELKKLSSLSVAPLLEHGRSCITNLSVFRMYLEEYLRKHPKGNTDMTFIIRELESTGKGLPVEIYMFAGDTDWVRYEQFQAEIFDYVYAVLPLFGLKAFQHLSSADLKAMNQPNTADDYAGSNNQTDRVSNALN